MTTRRRISHLAVAAAAFISTASLLPATPTAASAHELPSLQQTAHEFREEEPFDLTANPGEFKQVNRDTGSAAESSTTGYRFTLSTIPASSVYNRVLVRKSGQSYYSAVVRSTPGKPSYIQLEKVTNGKTQILQGTEVDELKRYDAYRIELEVSGTDNVTLSARVFTSSIPKPDWQVTATDGSNPLPSAAGIGVSAYVGKNGSESTTMTVNSLFSEGNGGDSQVSGWGDPVFNDDFNDASSLNKWNVADNDYVDYDWATKRASNVNVSDGNLIIRTERLAAPIKYAGDKYAKDRWYSTGALDTRNGKFSQEFGRFEIRAKLPTIKGKSRGIWPAFWLRPDNGKDNAGEIDIFEAYGTPEEKHPGEPDQSTRSQGTVHFNQENKKTTRKTAYTPEGIDVNDGQFHTWAVEWTPERITFFIDGQQYQEVKKSDDARWQRAFGSGDKYHLRLNTQVGSKYWGIPNTTETADKTEFVIDYVRAWKYQGQK